jgi:hypothetical protein
LEKPYLQLDKFVVGHMGFCLNGQYPCTGVSPALCWYQDLQVKGGHDNGSPSFWCLPLRAPKCQKNAVKLTPTTGMSPQSSSVFWHLHHHNWITQTWWVQDFLKTPPACTCGSSVNSHNSLISSLSITP